MWQHLTVNLAEISLIVLAWQIYADRYGDIANLRGRVSAGIVLGIVGCVSMATAEPLMPGFVFDLRSPTVACAAFFGGWIAAVPALLLTGTLRILIGGEGLQAGLLSLFAVALVGLALRTMLSGRDRSPSLLLVVAFGTGAAFLVGYLAVPPDKLAQVFAMTAVPATTLTILATWILAMLLQRESNRRALVQSNEVYRQMVDALPDCLNAKDLEGRFMAANPATARLMRAGSAEKLIGRTDMDFYGADEARAFADVEREVVETGLVRTVEQEILVDGRPPRWVATQKIPIRGEEGTIIGVITHNRDITHQRELLRLQSEFISTVSHELRTPLTSVRGSLVMMSSMPEAKAVPNLCNLLEIARRNCERLVRMINDILDVERIENGNLSFDLDRYALADLIRGAMSSLSGFMPNQNVTLAFDDRAPGAVAELDPGRFEQVLVNLLSNAIKFSPPGGTVMVGLARQDGRVVVSVSDTGRGIPDAFRERIFTRFEQADASDARAKGGTGLGLHIAKVMIERMNGEVRFTSNEGRGTTFFIEFPDLTPAPTDSGKPGAAAVAAQDRTDDGTRPRVLYVEDDDSLGMLVDGLLGVGVRTDHVGTLAEARAAIASARYDLAIIDDALPDGSGLALLRDLPAGTPAITFTAKQIQGPLPTNVRRRFVKTRTAEADVAAEVDRLLAQGRGPLARVG